MANEDLIHINVKEFTDNVTTDNSFEVAGTGIFDALMGTATKHLTAQLEAGRLRGEDYATAYIQVYTTTLQAALQAWLQKGIADKQIDLLNAQIASESKQPELLDAQVVHLSKQGELLDKQVELLNAQIASESKQPELLAAQTAQVTAQVELLNAQVASEEAKRDPEVDLLNAQVAIADKQLELLASQVVSEEAKKDLYKRQIEGFDEDYKQKILKICMDSWAVGFSVARDSFEATGIPAPMQKVTIDDLYNQYVVTELDKYTYGRPTVNKP